MQLVRKQFLTLKAESEKQKPQRSNAWKSCSTIKLMRIGPVSFYTLRPLANLSREISHFFLFSLLFAFFAYFPPGIYINSFFIYSLHYYK